MPSFTAIARSSPAVAQISRRRTKTLFEFLFDVHTSEPFAEVRSTLASVAYDATIGEAQRALSGDPLAIAGFATAGAAKFFVLTRRFKLAVLFGGASWGAFVVSQSRHALEGPGNGPGDPGSGLAGGPNQQAGADVELPEMWRRDP